MVLAVTLQRQISSGILIKNQTKSSILHVVKKIDILILSAFHMNLLTFLTQRSSRPAGSQEQAVPIWSLLWEIMESFMLGKAKITQSSVPPALARPAVTPVPSASCGCLFSRQLWCLACGFRDSHSTADQTQWIAKVPESILKPRRKLGAGRKRGWEMQSGWSRMERQAQGMAHLCWFGIPLPWPGERVGSNEERCKMDWKVLLCRWDTGKRFQQKSSLPGSASLNSSFLLSL